MDIEAPAPSRSERLRHIVATLAKHGIAAGTSRGEAEQARQLRLACEELGPTFIKLGQMLSTRGDVLPEDYRSELAQLQDSVEPVDSAFMRAAIEDELGETLDQLFVAFDPQPLASASIGQVYGARLPDGRDVVVKVRKPGVRELVERDLDILSQLASSGEKYFPFLRGYDVRGMVEEFGDTLRAELDYRREARNVDEFREVLADEEGLSLPEVIAQYSTSSVLTLTRVAGVNSSGGLLPVSRLDREAAAQRLATFVLQPALVKGIFHADPHGANVLIQADGELSIVDFGMVGRLNDELRRHIADLFLALSRNDPDRVADRLLVVAPGSRPVDRAAILQQLNRVIQRHIHGTVDRIRMGKALSDLIDIVREHGLRMPMAATMLFRAIAMSEGTILELAPQRSLADFLEPIADRVSAARLSPHEWSERARISAMDAAELAVELPRRADRVLSEVERGNLRVWARLEDLDPLMSRMERMVERANASMIASACIVAIAILFLVSHPAGWRTGAATILWVATIIAVFWVARTAWATIRRGG